MSHGRWLTRVGVCAALGLGACGSPDEASDQGQARPPVSAEPAGASAAKLAWNECVTNQAGQGFANDFIPQQYGTFRIDIDAAPRSPNGVDPIDGVVALSNGPADAFADLGVIVRFNPSGYIDVRKGSTYAADATLAYKTYYQFYHFTIDVNLTTHTYSVTANEHGYPAVKLATDYPFRTEQASVPRLDNLARVVDSTTGGIEVCGPTLSPTQTLHVNDQSGWASVAFPAQAGHFKVELDATSAPAGSSFDSVVGLSNGAPGGFSSLAAAVRFAPSGLIDVRNGGSYAYDTSVSYAPGSTHHFLLDVDMASHRYSVYVRKNDGSYLTLASSYAFRTQQSAVTQLDHLGAIVDGSDSQGDLYLDSLTIEY